MLVGAVQKPYSTNLLIAGWDEKSGPCLYWLDYLATMHRMNIAGTGYGAQFLKDRSLLLPDVVNVLSKNVFARAASHTLSCQWHPSLWQPRLLS